MPKIISDSEMAEKMKILKQLETEKLSSSADEVPPGYVKIELSTSGKLGAPKSFHIRNFKTTDLLDLALTSEEDLPDSVVKMLNNMIFEDTTNVKDWHEREIIELLVRLYMMFFSPTLQDVDFVPEEEDWEFLKNQVGALIYQQRREDYEEKRWSPKTYIDLSSVETYDIPEDFSPEIEIYNKKTKFKAVFTYPKFGDILVVKDFLKKAFDKEDKQFAQIKKMIEYRNEAEEKFREGKLTDLSKIPMIPESEYNRYREYTIQKTLVSVNAIRALHLLEIDGFDCRKLPISEKMKLVEDPRLDYILFKKVEDYYSNLKIGLKDDSVKMYNPITGQTVTRRFNFRLLDLLQAIKAYDADEYAIVSNSKNKE